MSDSPSIDKLHKILEKTVDEISSQFFYKQIRE